jgi:hypothetical protein
MNCTTCRHSRPALTEEEDGTVIPINECWRYPPFMIWTGEELLSVRPQVTEVDTCGEHDEA